jgi:hypothetical protein
MKIWILGISILATTVFSYLASTLWIFNNLNLREDQSWLTCTFIFTSMFLIFVIVVEITLIFLFVKTIYRILNQP